MSTFLGKTVHKSAKLRWPSCHDSASVWLNVSTVTGPLWVMKSKGCDWLNDRGLGIEMRKTKMCKSCVHLNFPEAPKGSSTSFIAPCKTICVSGSENLFCFNLVSDNIFNSSMKSNWKYQDHHHPQVMWRIFEAKPRTRLGRLSHARTHDDILDLVGHHGHDDGDGEDGGHDNRDCGLSTALIKLWRLTRIAWRRMSSMWTGTQVTCFFCHP